MCKNLDFFFPRQKATIDPGRIRTPLDLKLQTIRIQWDLIILSLSGVINVCKQPVFPGTKKPNDPSSIRTPRLTPTGDQNPLVFLSFFFLSHSFVFLFFHQWVNVLQPSKMIINYKYRTWSPWLIVLMWPTYF